MERSAIRAFVSGAGKSRISLRFMRATDYGLPPPLAAEGEEGAKRAVLHGCAGQARA